MKILIVGINLVEVNRNIKDVFLSLGVDCYMIDSKWGLNNGGLLTRLRHKLGLNIDKFWEREIAKESRNIIQVFDKYEPDAVIVYQGMRVSADAIDYMNKKAITVLKLSDSIQSYPHVYKVVDKYKIVSAFEKTDVDILEAKGITCYYTYGSVNTNMYYCQNRDRDIDVSFVGAMYPERRKVLLRLVKDLPQLNCEFYGTFANIKHPIDFLRWIISPVIRKAFKNKEISTEQVNEIYNRSKIVLNIQHKQSQNGWNSKTTEILATKSFEIINTNPAVTEELKGCLVGYQNYNELKNAILYYLKHPEQRESIAEAGYEKTLKNYTSYEKEKKLIEKLEALIKDKL